MKEEGLEVVVQLWDGTDLPHYERWSLASPLGGDLCRETITGFLVRAPPVPLDAPPARPQVCHPVPPSLTVLEGQPEVGDYLKFHIPLVEGELAVTAKTLRPGAWVKVVKAEVRYDETTKVFHLVAVGGKTMFLLIPPTSAVIGEAEQEFRRRIVSLSLGWGPHYPATSDALQVGISSDARRRWPPGFTINDDQAGPREHRGVCQVPGAVSVCFFLAAGREASVPAALCAGRLVVRDIGRGDADRGQF